MMCPSPPVFDVSFMGEDDGDLLGWAVDLLEISITMVLETLFSRRLEAIEILMMPVLCMYSWAVHSKIWCRTHKPSRLYIRRF